MLAGRAPAARRVGAFVRRPLEEVVLEGVVGSDARLGVIVEHPEDQVLELEVVRHIVTHLPCPPTSRTPRLHAYKMERKKKDDGQ